MQPRNETRPTSFNFVRTRRAVPFAATTDACTAADASGAIEPYRQLWQVEGKRLVLYVTDTGDFDRVAITRVKEEFSHLFLDLAPPGVLDDITEGMRRVLPDPICDSCRRRTRCGRRFHVVEGPPFANEEAWISRHMAGLRGLVLDVGCGEQLYREELVPLVRSGIVEYHGLDPDEHSISRLRAELPGARCFLGGIEEFRGKPASYDHILCLRSLNHVADADEAIARMAELLRPGGQLLLVESTPFAMLRRLDQVTAADQAPRAGHQHLRNLSSEDVLPLARRHALRVLQHHPASRETSNEWILLLVRGSLNQAQA